MHKYFDYRYVLGHVLGLARRFYPMINGVLLRLRRRDDSRELEAVAPFDSRIRFQHIVLKGKDGFLFHRDHDAIDQLTGGLVFRQRQLDVWIEAIQTRAAWCAQHHSAMRLMIIPEKHIVYPDKLPRYIKISENRPALQLIHAISETKATEILYPDAPLIESSKSRQTFYKTDTHWTSYGAYIAYRVLIASLQPEIPMEAVEETELAWSSRPYIGDLGVRFGKERSEIADIATPPNAYRLTFQNHNFGRGAVHIYENDNRPDLPTCVLFRDSFANAMIPFLMRGFSRLVAVSSLSCHYDLLDQEKPDVVLFLMIERFVATFGMNTTIELPDDQSGVSFAAFSGTDLSDVSQARRTG